MALSVIFVPLFFGGVLAAGETGDWRVLGIALAVSLMSACLVSLNRLRHSRVQVPAQIFKSRHPSA